MPAEYRVTRDQAVWERERYFIDVPDEIPLVEHESYIHEKLHAGGLDSNSCDIVDSVDGINTEEKIERIGS